MSICRGPKETDEGRLDREGVCEEMRGSLSMNPARRRGRKDEIRGCARAEGFGERVWGEEEESDCPSNCGWVVAWGGGGLGSINRTPAGEESLCPHSSSNKLRESITYC